MILENKLLNYDEDISHYGYTKLFEMYLEGSHSDRKYIYNNLLSVTRVDEIDVLTIIKYCSLYNRSYTQIKMSNDHTLFNGDYLNNLKILIHLFIDKLVKFDSKSLYITEEDEQFDYIELIVKFLCNFKENISVDNKFINTLYSKTYQIIDICLWNDLKMFYKLVYFYLTDVNFANLNSIINYEMFLFKKDLLTYLDNSNNIYEIEKSMLKDTKIHSLTPNYFKLRELFEIRKVCSDKSLTFYNDASIMLDVFKKNNLFDYSTVALQFFKIIEVEFKEKIIMNLSKDLNKQNLFEGLSEVVLLNSYNDKFLERLEFGKIRYILRQVKNFLFDKKNDKEILYVNEDTKIFYTRLMYLFGNIKNINFYIDILNQRVIDLYRNSSVHTGIVSYERALESRVLTDTFLNNLSNLNYSLKESNVIMITQLETPDFILEFKNN